LRRRPRRLEEPQQIKGIAIAEIEVHQQHIKIMLLDRSAPFPHAAGLRYEQGAGICHQLLGDDKADMRVVVHQKHPHRAGLLPREKGRPHRRRAVKSVELPG